MIPTIIRFLFRKEVKNTIADLKDQEGLLLPIVTSAWKTEKLPCDWNIRSLIKLPKKGISTNAQIIGALLCTASKNLTRIIYSSLEKMFDGPLRSQSKTSSERADLVWITLMNCSEFVLQNKELRSSLYLTSIDFKKAFDKKPPSCLWTALEKRNTPKKN